MLTQQAFAGDLRADAREFNRDKNSRVKWAHGQSYGPGRRESDSKPRPAKILPHIKYASRPHRWLVLVRVRMYVRT